ncbi:MAG: hypothetical protein JXA30_22760 [Deltaproteobacteria bacterium]|nr:hypothetical protein [Deltaproteobacteria bacterium]
MPEDKTPISLVRSEVRKVLESSKAYNELDDEARKAFAQNMVKVGAFLAEDPGWLDSDDPPETEQMAVALGPVDDLKKRLAGAPGQVGQDFQAGAMRQGVEEFGNLVKTVDFPAFVSGLIQGVFQAIVDASIQQMEAFGELLAATAKSVGEFANDYISDDQVREQVAQRYPSIVRIERTEEGNRLAPQEDAEDFSSLQQMARSSETVDFENPESELKFVTAAKLEMARQRQKMMALMVLLGINRIVVTNGRINAKVIFDIKTSDEAARKASASMIDTESRETKAAAAAWSPWAAGGASTKTSHKTTVQSAIDDTSESKAEMKAQLTGEVRVNFKSETLPPEKILDALQMDQINYLSQTGGAPVTAGAPASTETATPATAPAATPSAPSPGGAI